MEHGNDLLFYKEIKMMTGKAPTKVYDGVFIGTKKFVFVIPKKSVGNFLFVTTFKNHRYFVDQNVEDGCAKLLAEANSIEDLENTFAELLENDDRYVHRLEDQKYFSLSKFFRTYTFRFGITKMGWTGCMIKGKDKGEELRSFYQDMLKK